MSYDWSDYFCPECWGYMDPERFICYRCEWDDYFCSGCWVRANPERLLCCRCEALEEQTYPAHPHHEVHWWLEGYDLDHTVVGIEPRVHLISEATADGELTHESCECVVCTHPYVPYGSWYEGARQALLGNPKQIHWIHCVD